MTEKSYMWATNAPPVGDAIYSPYNSVEFNDWLLANKTGDPTDLLSTDVAFVIPGYLDDLFIDTAGTGTHSVVIKAGAAVVHNHLYVSDSTITISIDQALAGNVRYDSIVLRVKDNKVRLDVVKGVEVTAYPLSMSKPSLVQTAGIWEVEIATVLVYGSINTLENKHINDQRRFLYNEYSRNSQPNACHNLLVGGEWMSFSGAFGAAVWPPDMWLSSGTLNPYLYSASTVSSGRSYRPQCGGNFTLSQWVAAGTHKTYSVSIGLLYRERTITGGGQILVGLKGYKKDGTLSTKYKEIELPSIGGSSDTIISFTVSFDDNIEYLYFYITSTNVLEIRINQCLLLPGYHTGYYHQIDEPVMLTQNCTDAAWSATAKSTGATTINLGASFISTVRSVQNHAKAVILRLRGRDSGSAGGACSMNVQGYAAPFNAIYGTLELQGITNDTWEETYVIVPINQIYWGTGVAGAQFRINIVATGALTFDATVEIVGILT